MQIRELLNVQLETAEEAILKRGLWQLMNNRNTLTIIEQIMSNLLNGPIGHLKCLNSPLSKGIFFQHPDLMRLLRVHEDVMSIMMNVLTAQQSAADAAELSELAITQTGPSVRHPTKNRSVYCQTFVP